jgi:ferredoxin-NADP reductase
VANGFINSPMRRIPAVKRTFELEAARTLSPTVRELVLVTSDRAPFEYLAGQWLKLYLPGGIDRDYSIASAPDPAAPFRIVLTVTRVEGGPGSEYLHCIEKGTQIETLGPSGLFVREASHLDVPAIYVGTGTGLAPLKAMLEEELRKEEGAPQVLLFGCRTESDILYRDELESLSARYERLRFEVTLSRCDASWQGRRGWVQHHLQELAPDVPAHFYVCGLSNMVTAVRRTLKEELHIDRRFVHSERYD